MRLIQEMQTQGQWLFRWRSYLPLIFLVFFIPVALAYQPFGNYFDLLWEGICLLIGLFGMAIRCLVTGYVPAETSGRNTQEQIAETLNTDGLYSLVRNPLYLGNFFVGLAPVLLVHEWWLAVIYALAFVLYYERIIITEEAFLSEKFGNEYEQWLSQTPMLFPKLKGYRWLKPSLSFSWKHALRQEYHGLCGLIAVMAVLKFACNGGINYAWLAILIIGVIFYATVRYLSKCTQVLNVEDR
jgi:protein-S-isoprenylcysteine O-methyltransferase Ste14